MLPAVLVVGELNVDIVLSGMASPPVLGSEVLAQEMRMVLGSASAIFASGIARLGHPVGFVSKTGDDDLAAFAAMRCEMRVFQRTVCFCHCDRQAPRSC